MTPEQIKSLKISISAVDDMTLLLVENALQWVLDNTTLVFDMNNDDDLKALPACVRLFVIKFMEVNSMSAGITNESIEGLSQSFSSDNKSDLLWQYAEELLGAYLTVGQVSFVAAQDRWN